MKKDALPPGEAAPCWRCAGLVDAEDKFCRHCGARLGKAPWYYSHAGIVVLTLTILGPLSLFLVWRSPRFDRRTKLLYTAAIGLFTAWLLALSYKTYLSLNQALSGADLSVF